MKLRHLLFCFTIAIILITTSAMADFDGDGKTELVLFNIETGEWRGISKQWSLVFGEPGDVPVPADYNNDGKAELAVFRPRTGQWFIRGVNGAVYTGRAGDIPLVSGN